MNMNNAYLIPLNTPIPFDCSLFALNKLNTSLVNRFRLNYNVRTYFFFRLYHLEYADNSEHFHFPP